MGFDTTERNGCGCAQAHPLRFGFTLLELVLVVAIVFILASMVGVRLVRYHNTTVGLRCCAELREIAAARVAYAADNRISSGSLSFTAEMLHRYTNTTLANSGNSFKCPSDNGKNYQVPADLQLPPTCPNYTATQPTLHTVEGLSYEQAAN